jgi:membrane protein YfhO
VTRRGGRGADAAALLALVCLVLLVFGRALAGHGVFFQRDVLSYWRPQVDSLVRILGEGAPPVWNPYFEVGLPLLADPGYQVYYPPQWANLLLPPDRFYALFVAGYALFTAVGALLLGRAWRMPRPAALGFAVAWLLGGPFLSLVSNNPQLAGAAWIPWVLVALERALRQRTARAAALLGVAAALQLLAGSGDFALMSAYLAAARLGLWLARAPLDPRARVRAAARLCLVAGGFALALSAALWMPALAIVRAGGRAHMDPARTAYWSVHPATLADLVVPTAVASLPLTTSARETFFESREPFLPSLYLGAAAMLLGTLGLRTTRGRGVLLLAAVLLLVATALGRFATVHAWVLELPGTALFRFPVKYLVPAGLLAAALSGFGLAAFVEDWTPRRRRAVRGLGVAAFAVAGALLWWARALVASPALLAGIAVDVPAAAALLSRHLLHSAVALAVAAAILTARSFRPLAAPALTAAALVAVTADLFLAAREINPLASPELSGHTPPLLDAIRPRADGFPVRVLSRAEDPAALNRRVARGPIGWEREAAWALGLQEYLSPPTGARWGLGGAYDGDFTGLAPGILTAYSGVLRHPRAGRLAVNLLRAGGVDYVVTLESSAYGLPEVTAVESVYDAPLRLFRVPSPAPRVFLARARWAPHSQGAWEVMADPTFDPAREVVLVAAGGEAAGEPPPAAGAPIAGRLVVAGRRADRVVLDALLTEPAWVVLTEMNAPGWTAVVDGAAVPARSADLLFCAAPLPAGHHRVVFEYRAPGARAGLALTVAGLAALGLLFATRGRRLPSPEGFATIAGP